MAVFRIRRETIDTGIHTGCFGEGPRGSRQFGESFGRFAEVKERDPKEIMDIKEMGNITKFVFGDLSSEYRMFDSQVGSVEIPYLQGARAEIAFDESKRPLGRVAFNIIP